MFAKNQNGLELIPDILKSLEGHILRTVRLLGSTSLPLSAPPKRWLALIVDLFILLLPYQTILEVITTRDIAARILNMIFGQSEHALFYGMGVDLVEAIVATGDACRLIKEEYTPPSCF